MYTYITQIVTNYLVSTNPFCYFLISIDVDSLLFVTGVWVCYADI